MINTLPRACAADAPLPIQQHPLYARALGLIGCLAEDAALLADGRPIGRAQVIWRGMGPLGVQGLIVRGPMFWGGSTADRADALRSLAPHGLRMIEAEAPCAALPVAGYRQIVTGACIAELSLAGDAATRRARTHPKWRASLARAEAAGLAVRHQPFRGEADHWLLQQEAAVRRARRYRGLSGALIPALARADTHALRLFWTEQDGAPVAGMLFARHGLSATYLTGWSGPQGRAACAHHLILMQAAHWLAARGHIRLDLGQIDTHAAPGLARFKLGSGALSRQLGGSWLRLPFCGHPRRHGTGKARVNPLHPSEPVPSAPARHDHDDPATLRKPWSADDRPAAHHRPGA